MTLCSKEAMLYREDPDIMKELLRVAEYIVSSVYLSFTGLSKKMDGIWNRYNLKSTGRIYTFCVLKCSQKFKVLNLP